MIKLKDLLFEGYNDTDDSAGILYYCYDEALLCLGSRSGEWNVPKGHIQIGEEPLDGSVREFTEETQIVLNGIPELDSRWRVLFICVDLPEPIDDWVKEVIENEKGSTSELVS